MLLDGDAVRAMIKLAPKSGASVELTRCCLLYCSENWRHLSDAMSVPQQIVESLLERDLETFEWKPALAKEWEVSKDGMEFTFTLREKK